MSYKGFILNFPKSVGTLCITVKSSDSYSHLKTLTLSHRILRTMGIITVGHAPSNHCGVSNWETREKRSVHNKQQTCLVDSSASSICQCSGTVNPRPLTYNKEVHQRSPI